MIVTGLLFTSCTATVVQRWATSRAPMTTADYAPPPNFPGENRQALLPASATTSPAAADECKPEQPSGPRAAGAMPRFSPIRKIGPKD